MLKKLMKAAVLISVMTAVSFTATGLVSASESASSGTDDDADLTVTKSLSGEGVRFDAQGESSSAEPARSGPARSRPTTHRPVIYVPRFETLPDGSRCVRMVRRPRPDPLAAAVAADTPNILVEDTTRDFPLCPRSEVPPTSPAVQAADFWRVAGEDLLPRPAPRIAPGFMLAGKMAYLEANTTPTARFEHATPLGLLTIEATSTLFVDWGDGSGLDGPHDGPGAPWPDGTITHFWTTADRYDIRVIQRWTARWRLDGGPFEQLAGLATEGRIDDFEVRDLQAVRNF